MSADKLAWATKEQGQANPKPANQKLTFTEINELVTKFDAHADNIDELSIEFLSGLIESPSDQQYRLVINLPFAGTITETTTRSTAGTCTATFSISGVNLGGTANSVSTAENSQAHASANTFAAGEDIELTVSANSSCANLSFTIKFTKTLS